MTWILPVVHPAATFRRPTDLGPLSAHIQGFVDRLTRGLPPPPQLYVAAGQRELNELVKRCKRHHVPLAVDIETVSPANAPPQANWGLLPDFAELQIFGVGADLPPPTGAVGMSWLAASPGPWEAFKRALADPHLAKVVQNGIHFDLTLLRRLGLEVRGPVEDTRDLRRALVATSKTGLAFQAAVYLRCGPWKAEVSFGEGEKGLMSKDAKLPSTRQLLLYNAEDCLRTAQLYTGQRLDVQHEAPDERRRIEALYRQHLRTAVVAAKMHSDGFPVDEAMRRSLAKQLRELARERRANLLKLVRPFAARGAFRVTEGGVNERDLRALVFKGSKKKGIDNFGLEVPLGNPKSWTDTGLPSVSKDALLYVLAQGSCPPELREIIRACWQADAPLKALSTYVESPNVLGAIGPDGRLHPGHNSVGTETGRWSCTRPNLYNLSEEKEEEENLGGYLPNMRAMYVAPRGHVIVHRDFKQLELEVMADVSGDAAMKVMLATGDLHTARTRAFFRAQLTAKGVGDDQPPPKMLRKQGKIVGLAAQYGAGAQQVYLKVIEKITDASFEMVVALLEMFKVTHPGICGEGGYWDREQSFAEANGYNESKMMHRRRYYPAGDKMQVTETSNYPIQSSAADIANSSMVGRDEREAPKKLAARLAKLFPTAWLAMHTYDSFDVICREKDAAGVDALMDECMRGPWNIGAGARTFLSDTKIGQRWSEV